MYSLYFSSLLLLLCQTTQLIFAQVLDDPSQIATATTSAPPATTSLKREICFAFFMAYHKIKVSALELTILSSFSSRL
jgi:hypothetical protein